MLIELCDLLLFFLLINMSMSCDENTEYKDDSSQSNPWMDKNHLDICSCPNFVVVPTQ